MHILPLRTGMCNPVFLISGERHSPSVPQARFGENVGNLGRVAPPPGRGSVAPVSLCSPAITAVTNCPARIRDPAGKQEGHIAVRQPAQFPYDIDDPTTCGVVHVVQPPRQTALSARSCRKCRRPRYECRPARGKIEPREQTGVWRHNDGRTPDEDLSYTLDRVHVDLCRNRGRRRLATLRP